MRSGFESLTAKPRRTRRGTKVLSSPREVSFFVFFAVAMGAEGGRQESFATFQEAKPLAQKNYSTSALCPRLYSPLAMMIRWISLVPSQMRSTRSSRKKRSATFSRI